MCNAWGYAATYGHRRYMYMYMYMYLYTTYTLNNDETEKEKVKKKKKIIIIDIGNTDQEPEYFNDVAYIIVANHLAQYETR